MSGPGRFGHAEARQHFAGTKPMICIDGLLCDIGQHSVGAAEAEHRDLAKEHGEPRKNVVGAQEQKQ